VALGGRKGLVTGIQSSVIGCGLSVVGCWVVGCRLFRVSVVGCPVICGSVFHADQVSVPPRGQVWVVVDRSGQADRWSVCGCVGLSVVGLVGSGPRRTGVGFRQPVRLWSSGQVSV